MKIEYAIDRAIDQKLKDKSDLRKKLHTPSGKLSAGRLGHPVQWQILHAIGVPGKDIDPYTRRKFQRGDDVEKWLLSVTPGLVEKQYFLEYQNVVGYADGMVNTKDYDFPVGIIPMEIKSQKGSAFKWIKKDGPRDSDMLQASCYALAAKTDHSLLCYVSSDDYLLKSYLIEAKQYKEEIDTIIKEYNLARKEWDKKKIIPEFESKQKWQENKQYCKYPRFTDLNPEQAGKLALNILKREKNEQ
jgi:hypothetical protein